MYSKLTNEKFDLGEIINKNKLKNYLIEFKKNDEVQNSNFLWQLLNLEYLYRGNKE